MLDITGTVTHGYIPDNGPILYPAHKNVWSTHPLDKSVGMIHAARATWHVPRYGPGSNSCVCPTGCMAVYGRPYWVRIIGCSAQTPPQQRFCFYFAAEARSTGESENQPFWGINVLAFIVIQKFAFPRYI